MTIKDQTQYSNFLALDIRVGKVLKVEPSKATKPTYRITADFGPDIGEKVSVGAYTHYDPEKLVGLNIIGIMNLGTLKMGPERSEFFCIAVPNEEGDAVPLTAFEDVPSGGAVY